MAQSIDCAPVKPSPVKRGRFQTFEEAHHEKWPFVTIDEKGDTCENFEVRSTVMTVDFQFQLEAKPMEYQYQGAWLLRASEQHCKCCFLFCCCFFLIPNTQEIKEESF